MTSRNDYTLEQWQALRNAPQLVAVAAAAAGSSGLFGSLGEGMATASAIAAALRGEQPLLREIFTRDAIESAQGDIRAAIGDAASQAALNEQLQGATALTVSAALAALAAKGAPGEADAYRELLRGIATKVANAAKEGDFLGFGGERVSEGERSFLARLDALLDAARA
jgi:F0F1-type ATP synthase membrane subunit c/vacuolar-type H+-ATPase subunit K